MPMSDEDLGEFWTFVIVGVLAVIWYGLRFLGFSTTVASIALAVGGISAFTYWVKTENAKLRAADDAAKAKAADAKALPVPAVPAETKKEK